MDVADTRSELGKNLFGNIIEDQRSSWIGINQQELLNIHRPSGIVGSMLSWSSEPTVTENECFCKTVAEIQTTSHFILKFKRRCRLLAQSTSNVGGQHWTNFVKYYFSNFPNRIVLHFQHFYEVGEESEEHLSDETAKERPEKLLR